MKKVIIIITAILLLIIGALFFIYREQSVVILGYHSFIELDKRVEQNIKDNMIMDIKVFEDQLKYLKNIIIKP